jgi:hypothetical protein
MTTEHARVSAPPPCSSPARGSLRSTEGRSHAEESEVQAALAGAQAPTAALVLERPPWITAHAAATEAAPRRLRSGRRGAGVTRAVTAGCPESRTFRPPRSVVRGVDPELAAIDLLTIETPDGLGRLRLAGELDEREATRAPGFPVRTDVYVGDLSGGGEGVGELLLGGAETQVANKNLGRNGCTPFLVGGYLLTCGLAEILNGTFSPGMQQDTDCTQPCPIPRARLRRRDVARH